MDVGWGLEIATIYAFTCSNSSNKSLTKVTEQGAFKDALDSLYVLGVF